MQKKIKEIEKKYNIKFDFIKHNNKGHLSDQLLYVLSVPVAIAIVGGILAAPCYVHDVHRMKVEDSKVVFDSTEYNSVYNLEDIYAVYSVNTINYCTRKLEAITQGENVKGETNLGFGSVDGTYYRDNIYAYYDVKTGEKICKDHDYGYYMEPVSQFYTYKQAKDQNYTFNYNQITDDVDLEFLLSREPEKTKTR